jgi:predicted SprT family Zn-dependent metalloprotease
LSARPSHMSSMKVTMSEEEDAVMVTIVAWEVTHYPLHFTFFFYPLS